MKRSELEFKTGSILRRELLQDLYDYPRIAEESFYSGYSDGILYGLEWKSNDDKPNHHIIMPGALKFKGNLFFLSEQIDVEEYFNDKMEIDNNYFLCFVEKDPCKNIETQTVYELQLCILQSDRYNELKDKAFVYARVRCNHYNCLEQYYHNHVYGLFAANDGYNYMLPNWSVKKILLPILEKKQDKHPLDFLLLKEAYEFRGLSVSFSIMYCNEYGLNLDRAKNYEPEELLEKLIEAVENLKLELTVIQAVQEKEVEQSKEEIEGNLL